MAQIAVTVFCFYEGDARFDAPDIENRARLAPGRPKVRITPEAFPRPITISESNGIVVLRLIAPVGVFFGSRNAPNH